MIKNLNESLSVEDFASIALARRSGFKTEVIAVDEFGQELFRKTNTIVIGGQRFVLEKIFNIDPGLSSNRITLNKLYELNQVENDPIDKLPRKEKAVCLFGIGIGGSELTMGSTSPAHNRNYNLFQQIPFRLVETTNDLIGEERNQYYFRKVLSNGKVGYFLKRFSSNPIIKMMVNGAAFVPNELTDNKYIGTEEEFIQNENVEIFVEFNLSINERDIREYFDETEGLEHARINEIALFSGYQEPHMDWADYRDVECFSKLTFDNEPFTNPSKTIDIIYRIYL